MRQPHRAVPVSGTLWPTVACRVPGSVASEMAGAGTGPDPQGAGWGVVLVDAAAVGDAVRPGVLRCAHAVLYRTARRLFDGRVLVRAAAHGAVLASAA